VGTRFPSAESFKTKTRDIVQVDAQIASHAFCWIR